MSPCPTTERLRELLAGRLDDEEREGIVAHLDRCETCPQLLDRICDDDESRSWRTLLSGAGPAAEPDIDGDFLRKLREGIRLNDRGSNDGPASIRFSEPFTLAAPLGMLGRYEIQKELGAGSAGIVFLARDTDLDRLVAIKVLRPELALSRSGRSRFEREARAAVKVRHDHVVAIHDVGIAGDFPLPYIVMEYVEGETLAERIERMGRFAPVEAAQLGLQIAKGLAFAHARGLVHRDVKPSNVLIDAESGRAKLGDFGIARLADEGKEENSDPRWTRSGQIIGTPAYMSPEQITHPEAADARSDVYGLGCVVYQLLCGVTPFHGDFESVLGQVSSEEPPSFSRLGISVPRDLETIVRTCLAKDPSRRYQSAADMGADLNRWLRGEPIRARENAWWERTGFWVRRHPWVAGFWGLLGCATLIILAITWRSNLHLVALLGEVLTQKNAAERLGRQATKQAAVIEAELAESSTLLQRESIRSAERLLRQRRNADAVQALNNVPRERRGWEWDRMAYEAALSDPPRRIVGMHEWGVSAMLLSADDHWIVSAGEDGRLMRWDLATGASSDRGGGSWSKSRRAWRHVLVPMRKDEPENAVTSDCLLSLAWADHGMSIIAGSLTGKATIRTGLGGEPETLFDHPRALNAAASSPDGRTLVFGDDHGSLILCDRVTRNVKVLDLLKGSAILDLVPAGGKHLVVGQEDGTLILLDLETKLVTDRLTLRGPIWDIDVAADVKSVAIACGEAQLQTFSVDQPNGRLRRERTYSLPSPDQMADHVVLQAVRFSPDASRIAAGDSQGCVVVWDASDYEPSVIVSPSTGDRTAGDDREKFPTRLKRRISGLRFSANGNTLFTADLDSSIRSIELQQVGARRGTTEFSVGEAPIIRFDAIQTQRLWVACADGTLAIWDSVSREKLASVPAHEGRIIGLEAATTAGIAVTIGQDRAIRFWKADGGQIRPFAPVIRHDKPIRSVALTSDAARMAAYDRDNFVTLWDVATGREIQSYLMRDEQARPTLNGLVAFNPNGKILAIAGPGQTCCLVDGETLANPRSIYMFAGKGGTAEWH